MSDRLLKTPLHASHLALGARMTAFAGWELPLEYTGISDEHLAVRQSAGLFDVSHLGEIEISGPDSALFLDYLLTRDMSRLCSGRALYSPMCTDDGGTVDDLIVCATGPDRFLLAVNAANAAADINHIRLIADNWAAFGRSPIMIRDRSADFAQLALQGPKAAAVLADLLPEAADLEPFHFYRIYLEGEWLISRTGYTGEDGFELYLPPAQAPYVWQRLLSAGAVPAGLGARDSLRLEAALPLCGHELSAEISPIEAGLSRFVHLDKSPPGFIGQDRLSLPPARRLIGLRATGRLIPRAGYPVSKDGIPVGRVTSGGYSPSLRQGIALALVGMDQDQTASAFTIRIRGQEERFEPAALPFVSKYASRSS